MINPHELWIDIAERTMVPPPDLKLSEWTAQNRYLTLAESPTPGPWDPNYMPWQKGLLDEMGDPDNQEIAIMASTRVGKTSCILHLIGYYCDLDPAAILYVRPTLADIKKFSKLELTQLFESTPRLQNLLAANESKESSNTLDFKMLLNGGNIRMVSSGSPRALSGFFSRIVLLDELDRYKVIGDHGHPAELAVGRSSNNLNDRKIVYISSPTVEHTPENKTLTIHRLYLEGSQAQYHIPCPHCGAMQPLDPDQLKFAHCRETLDNVYLECIECLGHIRERDKVRAMPMGRWIHAYPDRKLKSYHISQLYSAFTTFENIAAEWLRVTDSRDIMSIRRFRNETLGLPFAPDLGLYKDSSNYLYNRREFYNNCDVPYGVGLLVMTIDSQDSWLDYSVIGFGRGRETWVIKTGRCEGDPATPGPWRELDKIVQRDYVHASGLRMRLDKVLIDLGGHRTIHTVRWLKGKAPLCHGIFGSSTIGKPIVTKPKRDSHSGQIRWEIGTEAAKDEVFHQLAITEPGPGFVHFPMDLDEDYFKELYSERKTASGAFKKIGSRRNEKLDELAYALVAYYICIRTYNIDERVDMVERKIAAIVPEDPSLDELEEMDPSEIGPHIEYKDELPKSKAQPPAPIPEPEYVNPNDEFLAKIRGFASRLGATTPRF